MELSFVKAVRPPTQKYLKLQENLFNLLGCRFKTMLNASNHQLIFTDLILRRYKMQKQTYISKFQV